RAGSRSRRRERTMIMELVRAQSLTKIYGTAAQPVCALKDINVTIDEGEFAAIMGPSGSGKSTLLYMIAGLERPTSGSVRLRDADISTLDDKELSRLRRKSLGLVFQFFNLLP